VGKWNNSNVAALLEFANEILLKLKNGSGTTFSINVSGLPL
jgi:hypothetical protein